MLDFKCFSILPVLYALAFSPWTLSQDLPLINLSLISKNNATIGNDTSLNAKISDDGRYIAYTTKSNNLNTTPSTNDTNCSNFVMLHDRQANTTQVISRIPNSAINTSCSGILTTGQLGDMSSDGRYISFRSNIQGLTTGTASTLYNVFLYDRISNSIKRISQSAAGVPTGINVGSNLYMSASGQYTSFRASGSIATPSASGNQQVFVYDNNASLLTLVSHANGSTNGANGNSSRSSVNSSGNQVIYNSTATDLTGSDINGSSTDYISYNISTNINTIVSTDAVGTQLTTASPNFIKPAISDQFALFIHDQNGIVAGDTDGNDDLFLKNLQTNQIEQISVSSSGAMSNGSITTHQGSSTDGRFVIFRSDASNLVDNDTNGLVDIFLRDRQTQKTYRINLSSAGTEADDDSVSPFITGDGRFIGFSTRAKNLFSTDVPPGSIYQVAMGENPLAPATISAHTPRVVPGLPPVGLAILAVLLLTTIRASKLHGRTVK